MKFVAGILTARCGLSHNRNGVSDSGTQCGRVE